MVTMYLKARYVLLCHVCIKTMITHTHTHTHTHIHTQEKSEDAEDDENPVTTTVRWRGAEVYASS